MINYRIRSARQADLVRCLEVDAGYVTTFVWQVREHYDDPTSLGLETDTGSVVPPLPTDAEALPVSSLPLFRLEMSPSRLPRPLAVPPLLDNPQLLDEWRKSDLLLIAETIFSAEIASEPSFPSSLLSTPAPILVPPPIPGYQPPPVLPNADVLGYISATVDRTRHLGWVNSFAVQPDLRRQGIGTMLLDSLRDWADRHRLRSLLIELQIKNYPAINFLQKNGFFFCGYNNAYYADREIAVFFGRRLEKFD